MKQAKPNLQQDSAAQNFSVLFEKAAEVTGPDSELWKFDPNNEHGLSSEIEQIKKIVEACNLQQPFVTLTRT